MRDVDICYSTVCFDCIDMYWNKKKKKKKKKKEKPGIEPMTLGDKASSFTTVTHHRGTISQYFILFQENVSNSFQVIEWTKNILQKSLKYFRCSKGHNSKSRLYRQSI